MREMKKGKKEQSKNINRWLLCIKWHKKNGMKNLWSFEQTSTELISIERKWMLLQRLALKDCNIYVKYNTKNWEVAPQKEDEGNK